MQLSLTLLSQRLAVCRLDAGAPLPPWANQGVFVSITRTPEELSLVCPEEAVPDHVLSERGWCCFRVAGPLAFSLTGVLVALAGPLAEARISIFAISTYDTDYLLVREQDLDGAQQILRQAGHLIT